MVSGYRRILDPPILDTHLGTWVSGSMPAMGIIRSHSRESLRIIPDNNMCDEPLLTHTLGAQSVPLFIAILIRCFNN